MFQWEWITDKLLESNTVLGSSHGADRECDRTQFFIGDAGGFDSVVAEFMAAVQVAKAETQLKMYGDSSGKDVCLGHLLPSISTLAASPG